MEPQAYSAFADLLNKFHTAPAAIQALWLLVTPLTVVGTAYCLMRAVRDVALALIDRRGAAQGRPVYAVWQAPDGRWMLYAPGAVRELPGEALPAGHAPAPVAKRGGEAMAGGT